MPGPKKNIKTNLESAPPLGKNRSTGASKSGGKSKPEVGTRNKDGVDDGLTGNTQRASAADDLLLRQEMLFIVMRVEEMKKKNERLHTEQESRYGVTLDGIKDMQKDINHAKAINKSLMDELEVRKARYDRLEADMVDLKKRFEHCQSELKQLKREQKSWAETDRRLLETENKYQSLLKTNRSLKTLLLSHSIHPASISSVPVTPTKTSISRREGKKAKQLKVKHIVWK